MASIEVRGESVRVTWLLGGRRGAAKQSCTFNGGTANGRLKFASAAKALVESRGHDISRAECYELVLGAGAKKDTGVPTFEQWAREWIEARRKAGDAQADVLNRYERCLKLRTVPYLGHKLLTDIDREAIKGWVQWMSGRFVTYGSRNRRTSTKTLAPQTITKHFMVTSACLAAAVPKWIPVNPAAPLPGERKNSVGLPRAANAIEAVFLDRDEVGMILRHCPEPLYDLTYVALRSGLRMGELLALEVRHVLFPRLGGATILVRRALKSDGRVGSPKSPASVRDVPVTGEAAQILVRRTKARRPADLVFTTSFGRMWNAQSLRSKHWYRAVAAAQRCSEHPPPEPVTASGPVRKLRNDEVSDCGCDGLLRRRPRFHDLRHTHASALIASGMHTKKVQRRLGHANYQTTMDVYGHLMDLGDDGELDGIEAFLTPA